jgi:formiminoglutamase
VTDTLRYVRADTTTHPPERKGKRDDPRMVQRMVALDQVADEGKVLAVLLGVADDRGVHLNGGRMGAADGPQRFRDWFSRLPATGEYGHASILSAGDLMPAENTTETHERLAGVVAVLRERFPKARVVVVGGGHDHAYGEVLGLARWLGAKDDGARLAVVNVDAHADVRPHTGEPHSGTPFRRLLVDPAARLYGESFCEWGLQRATNATAHLQWLHQQGAKVVMWDEIPDGDRAAGEQLTELMSGFSRSHAAVALSVDLDGFPHAASPGVSAPSPLGVPPGAVVRAAAALHDLEPATQLGLYELNPRFDQDGKSARLAARIAWSYLTGLL